MQKLSTDTKKKTVQTDILSGWKEIATYLGKGVRTVQRQERGLGLPVRRPAGRIRAAVVATKAELDGWIAAAPLRNVFQLSHDSGAKTTVDTRVALDTLSREVAELHRLREESAELRSALRESVALLRRTLNFSLIVEHPDEADVRNSPSKKIQ